MHITTPDEPTEFLWQGALQPPGEVYRSTGGVSASIGEPFQWGDGRSTTDDGR
jgi:hypothetical protein